MSGWICIIIIIIILQVSELSGVPAGCIYYTEVNHYYHISGYFEVLNFCFIANFHKVNMSFSTTISSNTIFSTFLFASVIA